MTFWKNWTIAILVGFTAAVLQYFFNVGNFVLENDTTYITSFIAAVYVAATITILIKSYYKKPAGNLLWFTSDVVMSVGMMGTLVGFLLVLTSSFQNVDTSDAMAMKTVIGDLAAGMGIALLTSLVGLISSMLIKLKLVVLEG